MVGCAHATPIVHNANSNNSFSVTPRMRPPELSYYVAILLENKHLGY